MGTGRSPEHPVQPISGMKGSVIAREECRPLLYPREYAHCGDVSMPSIQSLTPLEEHLVSSQTNSHNAQGCRILLQAEVASVRSGTLDRILFLGVLEQSASER